MALSIFVALQQKIYLNIEIDFSVSYDQRF